MRKTPIKSNTVQLSLAAVFTALVFVATTVFSVYVPQTRGFFNIGEVMVFATALLLGPTIGAFAGGVGSMLADLFLGYWYYAPATLIIKACEGEIVGLLARRKLATLTRSQWRIFTFLTGLIIGVLLAGIGSTYFSGQVELSFPLAKAPSLILEVPKEAWYVMGATTLLALAFSGFVFEPEFGWLTFTVLTGGCVMIAGYFLYQQFIIGPLFGISVIAVAEIPFNIAQMLIGLVVSIPLVKTIWRSIPSLKA